MLRIILIAAVLIVSGCVSPAKITNMAAETDQSISFDSSLSERFNVGSVSGGGKTNQVYGGSQVESEKFRAALEASLSNYKLLSSESDPLYTVDATIHEQSMPVISASTDATVSVTYQVIDKGSEKTVFNETIETVGHAKFSESLLAIHRGRLAKERAAQKNIEEFILLLKASMQ